jgi:hypothetical protein
MANNFFIALFSILFLTCSCDQNISPTKAEDKLCKRNKEDPDRLCTPEELKFITNWNYVASKINSFDITLIDNKFLSFGDGDYKNPSVALLGEAHIEMDGILTIYGYISYLAKNRKVKALEEGCNFNPNPTKVDPTDENFNTLVKLVTVVLTKELIDEGIPYHPSKWDRLQASRLKPAMDSFFSSIKHLIFPNNFYNVEFSCWDKMNLALTDEAAQLIERNKTMVSAINHARKGFDEPVVVIAGASHFPLGEYYQSSTFITDFSLDFPPDFSRYYPLAQAYKEKKRKERTLHFYEEWLTTSEVIFDHFSNVKNAIQLIPRTTLPFLEFSLYSAEHKFPNEDLLG